MVDDNGGGDSGIDDGSGSGSKGNDSIWAQKEVQGLLDLHPYKSGVEEGCFVRLSQRKKKDSWKIKTLKTKEK